RRVEAPLEVDPLDDDGTLELALGPPVGLGPDVDDQRAGSPLCLEVLRLHPVEPGPRLGQQAVDGTVPHGFLATLRTHSALNVAKNETRAPGRDLGGGGAGFEGGGGFLDRLSDRDDAVEAGGAQQPGEGRSVAGDGHVAAELA